MTKPALPMKLVVAERRRCPRGTACSISEAVSGVAGSQASAMTKAGRNRHVRPAIYRNLFRPTSSTSPKPKQYAPGRIGALPNHTVRKASSIHRPTAPRLVGVRALIIRRIPTAETRTPRTQAGPFPTVLLPAGLLLEVFSRCAIMNTLQKRKSDTCAWAAVFQWHHPTTHSLVCDLFIFVDHSTISKRFRVPALAGTSPLTLYRCLSALTMLICLPPGGTYTHLGSFLLPTIPNPIYRESSAAQSLLSVTLAGTPSTISPNAAHASVSFFNSSQATTGTCESPRFSRASMTRLIVSISTSRAG